MFCEQHPAKEWPHFNLRDAHFYRPIGHDFRPRMRVRLSFDCAGPGMPCQRCGGGMFVGQDCTCAVKGLPFLA